MKYNKAQWTVFFVLSFIGIGLAYLSYSFFSQLHHEKILEERRQKELVRLLFMTHMDAVSYLDFMGDGNIEGAQFAIMEWKIHILAAQERLGKDSEPVKKKFQRLYQTYLYINAQGILRDNYYEIFAHFVGFSKLAIDRAYEESLVELEKLLSKVNEAIETETDPAKAAILEYWQGIEAELRRSFELRKKFDKLNVLGYEIDGLLNTMDAEATINKLKLFLYSLEGIMQDLPLYEYGNYLMFRDKYHIYQKLRNDLQDIKENVIEKRTKI
jgi:hypothetical protein